MLSQLNSTLAFKIIQNYKCKKLITYYDFWINLNKTLNIKFNFKEFKGKLRNRLPKKNLK